MKSFKGYINESILLNEADTEAAKDMEAVIVSAAGGPKFTSALIPNSDEVGKRIVDKLKLSGNAYMPQNRYKASQYWHDKFKPDKIAAGSPTLTPKTDIVIGKKKISVKTGPAQLMGGARGEARATFYTALEKSGSKSDAVTLLETHINALLPSTDMTQYDIKGNKTQLRQAGKFAETEILKRADDAHHAFKKDFREAFIQSKTFAREFAFEAMTGKAKFGGNEGTADYFLVTDFAGNKPILHQVTKSSAAYVTKLMPYINPDVTFKSNQKETSKGGIKTKTGYYTFWSAVKLYVHMAEEEIKNADLLTENVIDVIKRAFAKAITWIKNLFKEIYKVVKKSYKNLLVFMDMEPIVSANGIEPEEIEWPR